MAMTPIPCSLEFRIVGSIDGSGDACQMLTLLQRPELPQNCHPERSEAESKDLRLLLRFSVSNQSGRTFNLHPSTHTLPAGPARCAPARGTQTAAPSPLNQSAGYKTPESPGKSPRRPRRPASYCADECG